MSKALDLEKQAYKALLKKRAAKPYTYKPVGGSLSSAVTTPSAKNDLVSAILNSPTVTPASKEEPEDFWGTVGKGLGDFVETPVVKSAIDALSTFGYATANMADQAITGVKTGNPGQVLLAPAVGLGKGLSGGFGGNQNDALTYSKLMDKHLGEVDEEDTAGKIIRGGAGFLGDVFLDPTTYLTLGAVGAAKAGAKAGQLYKSQQKAINKLGVEAVNAPIKAKSTSDAIKQGYAEKKATQKLEKEQAKNIRKIQKGVKRGTISRDDLPTLLEDVHGLEPAVAKQLIDESVDSKKILSNVLEEKHPEVAAALTAPNDVANALEEAAEKADDIPIVDEVAEIDITNSGIPSVGKPEIKQAPTARLADVKPVTPGQRLVVALSDVRAKTPDTKTKVSEEVLDEEALVTYLNGQTSAIKVSNGSASKSARSPLSIAKDIEKGGVRKNRAIAGLPSDLVNQFKVTKESEKIIPSVKTTGELRSIARQIKSGKLQAPDALKSLAGTEDPNALYDFILDTSKTDDFKNAVKAMQPYNTGSRLPAKASDKETLGHALAAIPSTRFSQDDIIASQTPTLPDEAQRFLQSKYAEVATEVANHKHGAKVREIADRIFGSAVGVDKLAKGANSPHPSIEHLDKILYEVNKIAPKAPRLRDELTMLIMRDTDNRLRLAGIEPSLTNKVMEGDKLVVRLAPSDILERMGQNMRMKYLWRDDISKVPIQRILDLAEVLVRSTTKVENGKIDYQNTMENAIMVLQGMTRPGKLSKQEYHANLEAIVSKLVGKDSQAYKDFKAAKTHDEKMRVAGEIRALDPAAFNKIAQERIDKTVIGLAQDFVKGFKDGKPSILSDLVNTNMRNASVFAGNVSAKLNEVALDHMERLQTALTSGTPDEFFQELLIRPPFPFKNGRDPAINAMRTDAQKAVQDAYTDATELKHMRAANENVQHANEAVDPKRAAQTNAKAYQENPELVAETQKLAQGLVKTDEELERIVDLSIRERNADVLQRMFGFKRFFNARSGMNLTYETVVASAHAATHLMTGFHKVLKSWQHKGYSKDDIRVAFKQLQGGEEALSPIAVEVGQVLQLMFSPTTKEGVPISNFLTRNTVGPTHFNNVLKSVGFDKNIQVPLDATPAEMAVAWREWEVENPVDFLSKMMHAMVKTSEDVSLAASLSRKFGKDKWEPGYAKMSDTSKRNELLPLMDLDKYYPLEVIDEVTNINRHMLSSRSFKPGTAQHAFVTQIWDPVISTLKLTQTTLKPGHHVMSVIGDSWMNHLAGVKSSDYKKAARIMQSARGSQKGLEPIEEWAQTRKQLYSTTSFKGEGADRSEVLVIAGRPVKIPHSHLHNIFKQKGVYLPAHIGSTDLDELADFQQLQEGVGSAVGRGVHAVGARIDRLANPNHGKYSLNEFTAARDGMFRSAAFLRFMQEKNFKTLDAAVDYAADKMRSWRPTAADLGSFESKYARRAIFYYTWLRGAFPRVLETALTRPGISTVPSKLMYNWAQASGLDPMSIGDPFPEDTLLPDWYSERVLGPQWTSQEQDLWGLNPTGPTMDVFNSLGSGVRPADILNGTAGFKFGTTLLNMSTPWFKAPTELITGARLDGGAPIRDRIEYMQDMIGPARVASRIAGKDFYLGMDSEGDIGMPNRSGSEYREGLGNDFGPNAVHELINYLTGLQFTNYTSDSMTNTAEFQERDKLREERRRNLRFGE